MLQTKTKKNLQLKQDLIMKNHISFKNKIKVIRNLIKDLKGFLIKKKEKIIFLLMILMETK